MIRRAMPMHFKAALAKLLRTACLCALASVPPAYAQDAAALAARHEALRGALAVNAFKRPLFLESSENGAELKGDVYARLEQPFPAVRPALRDLGAWCDILILHQNVKRCRVAGAPGHPALMLDVGRKVEQPLEDAYQFEFLYELAVDRPDYLQVVLGAAVGPLGTSRYRIVLEAVPLPGGGSFVHLSYGYVGGIASRLATRMYLATIGRAKVGFSVVGKSADGQPVYIGGTRGAVERNAMRYYLAIEAYLGALALPEPARLESRLRDWYAAVERYPLQLHELDRDAYLDMKRMEIRRQALPPVAVSR